MYNNFITSQDNTVCFWVSEEATTDNLPNGDAENMWGNYQGSFSQPQGLPRQGL